MSNVLLAYQDEAANAWEVKIDVDLPPNNDPWLRSLAAWILENLPEGMGGFGATTPVSIFVIGIDEQRTVPLTE